MPKLKKNASRAAEHLLCDIGLTGLEDVLGTYQLLCKNVLQKNGKSAGFG